MRFPIAHLFSITLFAIISGASPANFCAKPPYFLLIGDSTVAVNGGWGNGFLSYLKSPGLGENRGVSGSTTVSWKSNGRWDALIETIEASKGEFEPIVTIQFGHNDQKVLGQDEFRDNLQAMAIEIEEVGGTPIFITSLTRRRFEDGQVVENLADWRNKTIEAAKAVGVKWLDLNKASTDYVNTIGEDNAHYYNLNGSDRTHLNLAGEIVFGRMTLDLLLKARPDLRMYFESNVELSDKLANGEFATGEE
ncbi:SGNH-hydro domain-containing protein [Fusarium falciforme]|uniref:SGNH-hydro domain-containing protein n=1 Tax=Fusarium falciforme TaxID=195108 RepID=UPI002300D72B|nr:SGNH-hydro domain-containing protein [Fusarium falciforme]WAO91726.1 SGNH-hydro domain-containing protein [Fusarium falciforme]